MLQALIIFACSAQSDDVSQAKSSTTQAII